VGLVVVLVLVQFARMFRVPIKECRSANHEVTCVRVRMCGPIFVPAVALEQRCLLGPMVRFHGIG
jgi:hypothetical protein